MVVDSIIILSQRGLLVSNLNLLFIVLVGVAVREAVMALTTSGFILSVLEIRGTWIPVIYSLVDCIASYALVTVLSRVLILLLTALILAVLLALTAADFLRAVIVNCLCLNALPVVGLIATVPHVIGHLLPLELL